MVYTDELICPVCGGTLEKQNKSLVCQNRHCFDISKEGYVNLLYANHKSAGLIGDNKDMARSRHAFLEKGYFQSLSNGISDYILSLKKENPVMLDICCGEGYYSGKLLEKQSGKLYGFDLSQKMVRLAAKRKLNASFFVANLSHIPMKDACTDIAFHLFAPFHEKEFSRILKKDGVLLSVVPGENHLLQLKESVYETAYKNDEKLPQTTVLKLTDSFKIKDKIFLPSSSDIMSLFKMTPYYYRTAPENIMKAEQLESLETVVEFVVGVYKFD
ncbi:MAG: putative RNA methyltransferase [Acutalibacteraceae bacterium]